MLSLFGLNQKKSKPRNSQGPGVEFWNFSKISLLTWVMAITVWFQIVVLFDRFLQEMSLFVVFTVFTSMMLLFWLIPFKPASKICPKGPEALTPLGWLYFLLLELGVPFHSHFPFPNPICHTLPNPYPQPQSWLFDNSHIYCLCLSNLFIPYRVQQESWWKYKRKSQELFFRDRYWHSKASLWALQSWFWDVWLQPGWVFQIYQKVIVTNK